MPATFIRASLILPIHHAPIAQRRGKARRKQFFIGAAVSIECDSIFEFDAHSIPNAADAERWLQRKLQGMDALRSHEFVSISRRSPRRGEITRALRAGKPGPHYCRRKRYFYWRQKRIARRRSFHVRCFIGRWGSESFSFSLAFPAPTMTRTQRNTLWIRAHTRARDFCKMNDPSGGDIPDKCTANRRRL